MRGQDGTFYWLLLNGEKFKDKPKHRLQPTPYRQKRRQNRSWANHSWRGEYGQGRASHRQKRAHRFYAVEWLQLRRRHSRKRKDDTRWHLYERAYLRKRNRSAWVKGRHRRNYKGHSKCQRRGHNAPWWKWYRAYRHAHKAGYDTCG